MTEDIVERNYIGNTTNRRNNIWQSNDGNRNSYAFRVNYSRREGNDRSENSYQSFPGRKQQVNICMENRDSRRNEFESQGSTRSDTVEK